MTMQKLSAGFSMVLSCLFHPLLIPTYGMLLYRTSFMFYGIDRVYPLMLLIEVFLTIIVPVVGIVVLKRVGKIKTYGIETLQERKCAYMVTLPPYLLLSIILYFVFRLHLGYFMSMATIALFILLMVNFFWKMSAHLVGFGGLLGAVMAKCYSVGLDCGYLIAVLILLAGVLAYARIDLKSHTWQQTLAGFLVGFCCLFFTIHYL